MQLRVLFIVSNYPHLVDPVAGIFYKRIVDQLVAQGIQVSVVVPTSRLRQGFTNLRSGTFRKHFDPEVSRPDPGLTVYRPDYLPVPFQLSGFLYEYFIKKTIIRALKKYRIAFDLVDSRSGYPWCHLGVEIGKNFQKPVVCTFIGSDINVLAVKSALVKDRIEDVLKRADIINVVSSDLKKTLSKRYNYHGAKVIFDGIDLSKYENLKKSRNAHPDKHEITIGFVGQLSNAKGAVILLELIQHFDHKINWLIIGEGIFGPKLSSFKNVKLTGKLEPNEVMKQYRLMDAFILPTQGEGIPNVVKEAAFLEVPVIASNVGGIPEAMDDGRLGIMVDNYQSPDAFIKAIMKFIENRPHYEKLARRHSLYITAKFGIVPNVELLISDYNKILSNLENAENG